MLDEDSFRHYFYYVLPHTPGTITPAEYGLEHVDVRVDFRGDHCELYFSRQIHRVTFVVFSAATRTVAGLCAQVIASPLLSLYSP